MPSDPWPGVEVTDSGAEEWPGEEVRPTETRNPYGATLSRATGLSATPWYSQGIFGGYGPSVTDALDTLPAVGGAIGGAVGAGSGAFAGLGLGAAPGAVGGAAFGGQAGEAARQIARSAIGAYSPRTSGEAATEIGQQGGVQAAAEVVGRGAVNALGRGVRTVLPAPEKQYAQALGATTVQNKQLSERIVPELIRRRVTGSRESIAELAEREAGKAGTALDAALANVPAGKAADVGAVMDTLQKLKRQYVVPSSVPGTNVIVDQAAYNSLGEMQRIVASTQPTFASVRRLRQILDTQVTAGDKTFGRTIAEGSSLDATREAANAIRRELAKTAPDVALINKEFTFWKNVERVVGATIQRTASQARPLGAQIAEGVATPAVVAGTIAGGTGGGIAATTAGVVALRRLVQSPQWKTFSAVQKDRLAEAIARGDAQQIGAYLAQGSTGLAAAARSEPDEQP